MADQRPGLATEGADREPGELVFCGTTEWSTIGRSDGKKKDAAALSLSLPHRLRPLSAGIDISFVATGCVSCHCIAVDISGRCFTWGRNEMGQLGLGHRQEVLSPSEVLGMKGMRVVWAAAGRNHTAVVLDDGRCYSWGHNKHGQLGSGFLKAESEASPVLVKGVQGAETVACGADFTVWITAPKASPGVAAPAADPHAQTASTSTPDKEGGEKPPPNILTAGLPQYGQLGHGTDNQYNAKEGTVKIVFDPQPHPRRVAALAGRRITKVACGNNHTVAVDSSGFVYTWGFGGHGRLGHREQKDEFKPRIVETFQRNNTLPPTAIVAAGTAFSACTAGGGQLYMWGRIKATGDSWMYPKPLLDLSGWNIRSMACGSTTSAAAADNSCITWGTAHHGELGYGPTGPKSSANPKKVDSLENFHCLQVGCGQAHMLMLLSRRKWMGKEADARAHIDKLPLYDAPDAPRGAEVPKKPGKAQGERQGKKAKGVAKEEKEVEEEKEEESEGSGGSGEDEDAAVESEEEEEEDEPKGKRRAGKRKASTGKKAAVTAKKSKGSKAAANRGGAAKKTGRTSSRRK